MDKDTIKKLFPKRKSDSHKGNYGKVFILAGSEGMLGAAILTSRGALRAGAGLVYLGVPKESRDIVNIATPEVIVAGGNSAQEFKDSIFKTGALAVGPGLGHRRVIARDLLFKLSDEKFSLPIVLDADGLMAFINDINSLKKLNLNLILTPHPGEMSRLLSRKPEDIQKNREKIASETAKLLNCVVVLKGHNTIIADQSGELKTNPTGNPGMATAGVGDILTGLIAGFAAQGMSPNDAACAGAYIHGLAGDLAAEEKGEYGLIAGDIIEKIPQAIIKVQKDD
ncbi:MAG: NAD(P)H-hydrate dehydratase [Candidatus Margulisiibacteriota bacterium]